MEDSFNRRNHSIQPLNPLLQPSLVLEKSPRGLDRAAETIENAPRCIEIITDVSSLVFKLFLTRIGR